jgi:Ca-activated chloride channel family protein
MTEFHFLRPWWLLALPALLLLLMALRRRQPGADDWREFCDPALLPHVLVGIPGPTARAPLWLAGAVGAVAVLALSGPAWERLPTPVFRNLSALVVVLDLSTAMSAADLKPSRAERARFKIEDLLRGRKDGQTALVVYAGDAFTVTPLTDDTATIAAQLSALSPALMPVQGSRADLGLEAAGNLLKQAGLSGGDVLLISSGEGLDGAETAASGLRVQGYRVSALGAGTPEGAPVPLPGGGFQKDAQGNILLPRLDAAALARLAEAGGGLYRPLRPDSGDIDALLRFFDRPADAAGAVGDSLRIEQWREAGVFLLPLLLPLAALGFRRGWLGAWLLLALAPMPQPALAFDWQDLWLTPDQRAQGEFQAGHPELAAQRFRNPEWKAAAEYKAGQYPEAAKALEPFDTPASQDNRGNALAHQGQYEQAIQAYQRALDLNPGDQDAEYNKKLVEEALRKQQEQQKKQDQNGPQPGDQSQESQGKQGEKDQQDQSQPEQAKSGEQGAEPQSKPGQEPQGQQQEGQQQLGDQPEPSEPDQQASGESPPPDGENQDAKPPEPQPAPGEAEQEAQQAQQGQPDQPGDQDRPKAEAESDHTAKGEIRQAEEQWLRRIPDDPGGLLKRKFYYQYRKRQQRLESEREPW